MHFLSRPKVRLCSLIIPSSPLNPQPSSTGFSSPYFSCQVPISFSFSDFHSLPLAHSLSINYDPVRLNFPIPKQPALEEQEEEELKMASDSSTVSKDDKNMSSSVDSRRQTSFLMAQAGIRIMVIAFTLVAISVTVTNSQSVVVFGMNFQAHYTYSSALKFLVAANSVLCSFSALSLVYIYYLSCSGTTSPLKKYFFLFLLDTVMMVLITAACAAATAIGYVGKYGEEHMTWQPTCGYVSKFCNRMSVSLTFSYLAFFASMLLNLMSAHALIYRPIVKS